MTISRLLSSGLLILLISGSCVQMQNKSVITPEGIDAWITTADKSSLFAKTYSSMLTHNVDTTGSVTITIDSAKRYQGIDGFGFSLTGGSAYLINKKLSSQQADSLLNELFLTDGNNIGISYLRISIGASDLNDHVFTYNDLPAGETDPEISKFDLGPDKEDLIPVLKKVIALNPKIKILGSPWSAPAWMKTNNNLKAGSLKPEYYGAYANYLVKYVQVMVKEGIPIDAITLQNEPENPKNNPSMVMTAGNQADFVKNNLGPAFKAAGIKTKIIVFDHNCDHPNYPIEILNDEAARKFIDGSAFHLYLGQIDALTQTHNAYPDKNVYFTEQWTWSKGKFGDDLAWHTKNLTIGAPRNWSRNVLEWNLAADANYGPHTDSGGCDACLGALTIDNNVTRNVSYYIIAHSSKFVRPGSVRIDSNIPENLSNVAYVTPEGKIVLIVINEAATAKSFKIKSGKNEITTALPAGAVGTFVW